MKCVPEHINDTIKKSVVEETEKVQAAARLRLAEVMVNRFLVKPFAEVIETASKPEIMAEALKTGLEATGLLLDEADSMGTLRMNVGLNMHPAPRNFDEELDRLAEKYGAEYIAEQLLKHTSSLANIKTAEAERERERGRGRGSQSRQEPVIGKHSVSYDELHGVEAATNLKASVPTEDLDTGEPTFPEACAIDILRRFLLTGKYSNPASGAWAPLALELAIADAITYGKELMDLRKVQAAQEDDGK